MATIVINPDAFSLYPLSSDNVFGIPYTSSVNYSGLNQTVLTGQTTVFENDENGIVYTNTAGYLQFVTNWNDGPSVVNTTTIFPFVDYYSQTDFGGPGGEIEGTRFAHITQIITDGISFTPTINSNSYGPASYWLYVEIVGHFGEVLSPGLRTSNAGLAATLLANNDTITNLSQTSATLLGYAGNDHLIAGSGGDILIGGTGSDVMDGGFGNDTFYVDQPTDVVNEQSGHGFDTVHASSTWHATAGSEIELLTADGTSNIALTGNAHAMEIRGNSGVNVLDDGGAADQLYGGANSDVYLVHNANTVVHEDAGGGYDTIKTDLTFYELPAQVEVLKYTGGSDFHGVGGDSVEIDGGDGNDTLEAGASSRLVGGTGDDTYVVHGINTSVVEATGGGTDTVNVSVNSYVAPANVEIVVFTGAGPFNGYGNATGVHMIGSAAGGQLHGGAGNDVLDGNGGNTVMFGNGGADTFVINPYDASVDHIVDFQSGDHIQLTPDFGFVGLNWLASHPTPSDWPRFNADSLEYNQQTGDLFLFKTEDFSYTLVAHLDNHPGLAINDFILA